MQSKDATGSSAENLYTMLDVLVGNTPESQKQRLVGANVAGRTKLTHQYKVPNTRKAPFPTGKAGYLFINYESGPNFNNFIASLTDNGVATMTPNTVQATLPNRATKTPAWQTSALFSFLDTLAENPDVNTQFHAIFPGGTADQQQAFFNQYLPTNYYGEQDAVTALMKSANQSDFSALLQTFNLLVTTFNAKYGLCC